MGTYVIGLAVGGVVFLMAWLYIKGKGKTVSRLYVPQFMFTASRSVLQLSAESFGGVLLTKDHGGQVEDTSTLAVYRRGRLMFPPRAGRDPGTMRKRSMVYLTRQNDASTVNLRALFDDTQFRHRKFKKSDISPLEDLAAEYAMANSVSKPSHREMLVSRLSIIAGAIVVLGGVSWAGITLTASLQG